MSEKYNTIVWGFDYQVGNEIINSFKNVFNIKYLVSDHKLADIKKIDFILNVENINFEKNYENFNLRDYFDFREANFSTFNLVMSIRNNDYIDISEVNNEFYILYCYFLQIIEKRDINLIIFSAPPHEGPDYILYKIAQNKKIKVVICSGSSFTNKFFLFSNLNDWGLFKKNPDINKNISTLDKLNYSKKVRQLVYSHESKWKKRHGPLKKIKLNFIDLLIYLKIIRRPYIDNQNKYFKNLENVTIEDSHFNSILNQDKKIALFALHYEPEAATNILGGNFSDQVLAIETLDNLLNEDWIILVKEHLDPPQSYKFRGELFFKRLKKIKRLHFINKNYNLMDVIKKIDLISTITGTAGWESLAIGKKCLVFGNAWYQEIHGCIKYEKDLTYDNFIKKFNQKFNKNEFDNSFVEISQKFGEGIVDEYFVDMIENFNYSKNAKSVTDSISNFISKIEKNEEKKFV